MCLILATKNQSSFVYQPTQNQSYLARQHTQNQSYLAFQHTQNYSYFCMLANIELVLFLYANTHRISSISLCQHTQNQSYFCMLAQRSCIDKLNMIYCKYTGYICLIRISKCSYFGSIYLCRYRTTGWQQWATMLPCGMSCHKQRLFFFLCLRTRRLIGFRRQVKIVVAFSIHFYREVLWILSCRSSYLWLLVICVYQSLSFVVLSGYLSKWQVQ